MNETLKYKDYIGSINFDANSDTLSGKILHINDLVTYEARSPGELQKEFEASVDEYINACNELGIEPQKSFSGSFNVRMSPDLHLNISKYATVQGKSLNAAVSDLLSSRLEDIKNRESFKTFLRQSSVKKRIYNMAVEENKYNVPQLRIIK